MKFNVEIEIDWIDDENNLDGEIQDQIVSGLAKKIEAEFSPVIAKTMAQTAHSYVKAKTELIINTVLEKPVTISTGWQKTEEYDSIFDMVESRMSALYEKKIGNTGACEKDPLLKNVENYVDQRTNKLLSDVDTVIKKHAEKYSLEAVQQNKIIQALSGIVTVGGKKR